LNLIPGVELSCHWEGREIHIVGLFIDIEDDALLGMLGEQQLRRRDRVEQFAKKLSALGIEGLRDYMNSLHCESWTRTHVANFLVTEGHAKNNQKAFKKYLARKGKIYVPAEWPELEHAVSVISNAGGIAVLAHPGRYPLSRSKLLQLIIDFKDAGGEAMEVSYGNIDPQMRKKLVELATANSLFESQGSDFHSADATWTDLGRFPEPGSSAIKNAIWLHPRWHFSKPERADT